MPQSLGPNETLIGVPGSRAELTTPALVLDLDILEANIHALATHARSHGYALRPGAKVHKSTDIAKRQVAAGAIGVACATLAEAEVMVDAGIPGVMLFAPSSGGSKLERLAALNARTTDLVLATDGQPTVAVLDEVGRRSGRPLQVLIDVYVGGRRTGIADAERVVALARAVADAPHLTYAGVHAYVGGLKKTGSFDARRAVTLELLQPLVDAVERLHKAHLPPRIVSGGGTASHDIDHELGVFTENKAGTYAVMDVNYLDCVMRRDEASPFQPALTVRTSVTNAAQPGFVVTDAGYKELDLLHGLVPVIHRGAPRTAAYSIVGDDMGRIDLYPGSGRLDVGDAVEVIPAHCYLTAPNFARYHVVRGDRLVDIWPLAATDNV